MASRIAALYQRSDQKSRVERQLAARLLAEGYRLAGGNAQAFDGRLEPCEVVYTDDERVAGAAARLGVPCHPIASPPEPKGWDATPAAHALAESEGVDLTGVKGTGSGGRITKADVASAIKDS